MAIDLAFRRKTVRSLTNETAATCCATSTRFRRRVSRRSDGCAVGATGAAEPFPQDRRTTAPERGDERDPLSAAHWLPLALSAGAIPFRRLDHLQHLAQ